MRKNIRQLWLAIGIVFVLHVLLTLSGCTEWPLQESLDPAPQPAQWAAIGAVRDLTIKGEKDPGEGLKVYWSHELCPFDFPETPANTITAVVDGTRCYHGVMFGCESIFVAARDDVYRSALAHEVNHCYRQRLTGNGDPAHTHSSWDAIGGIEQCGNWQ